VVLERRQFNELIAFPTDLNGSYGYTSANITGSLDTGCLGTEWANFTISSMQYAEASAKQIIRVVVSSGGIYTYGPWRRFQIKENFVPTLPASISVEITEEARIQLSWPLATDNVNMSHYIIYRKPAAQGAIQTSDLSSLTNWVIPHPTTEFLDTTLDIADKATYYYAIRSFDRKGNPSASIRSTAAVSQDVDAPTVLEGPTLMFGTRTLEGDDLNFLADRVLTIRIRADEDTQAASYQLINQQSASATYGPNTLTKSGNYFTSDLDITAPKGIANTPLVPGTYRIVVTLTDIVGNSESYTFESAFTVLAPEPPPGEGPDLLPFIILAVAAASVVLVVVMQKRKRAMKVAEMDLEVVKGGKATSRKRKIYEGASAVGAASGMEAEIMSSRRGKGSAAAERAKTSAGSSRSGPPSAPRLTVPSRPPAASRSTVDDFEGGRPSPASKPKTDAAAPPSSKLAEQVAMRSAEQEVDLERKLEFLLPRIDGVEQSVSLSKLILEQTLSMADQERPCPKCGALMGSAWTTCAHCSIARINPEVLKAKQAQHPGIGQSAMCPVCHKLIDARWSRCPFCYARDRGV
jgi:hypothetical protein